MATFVYFVLDGTLMGMWLVQIPAVRKRAGISHATLGSLLVLLGLGAFIGMRRLLRDVAENRPAGDVTTLADSSVMDLIARGTASTAADDSR